MADSISVAVDRMVTLIKAVPNIGRVYGFDPWHRDDISDLIHSDIAGVRTLRCWWVSGPTMTSRWLTGPSPRHVPRQWTFEVHGIEGARMTDPAKAQSDIQVCRDLAVAVSDALDATVDLGINDVARAFTATPCVWRQPPRHDWLGPVGGRWLVVEAVVEKQLSTMFAMP